MQLDRRERNRILAVLFLGVLMGALDIAIVGPALPAIRRAFGVDARASAWIFSLYVLFNLIGTPWMAKLSDRYGRRSIYVLDVALFALGSLTVALAPSFPVLLAGRALQGFGAGGIFPVASAVIGDTFPPERRGSALGLIGAVFGLAFLIGPILGGILLAFGWPWLFLINLPLAAAVAAAAWRLLPTAGAPAPRPFDRAGMAILALLLAAFAYGLSRLDATHLLASLTGPQAGPWLLLALLLSPLFLWVEARAADPVVRLSLFRSRQVALGSLLSLGAGLEEGALVFLPSLAVVALGVEEREASFLLLPVVLAMAVGSPVVGRLLDRQGSRRVLLVGTGILSLGMAALGRWPTTRVGFLGGGVLIGLGLSALLGAPLRYIFLNEVPAADRGAAQGLISLLTSVGQLLSGALIGAVAASLGGGTAGYAESYLLLAGFGGFLWALSWGLKPREAERRGLRPEVGSRSPRAIG